METIELLDSDSDFDEGDFDPYSSRTSARGTSSSSVPTEKAYHYGRNDPSALSDSTITRETQESTNAVGVHVKGLNHPQVDVEITICDSDSSININNYDTPSIKNLPSTSNDTAKAYFELYSETDASLSPLIGTSQARQDKSKGANINNLQSDSESSSPLKSLKLPSRQIKRKNISTSDHVKLESKSVASSWKPLTKSVKKNYINNHESRDDKKLKSQLSQHHYSETEASLSPMHAPSHARLGKTKGSNIDDLQSDSESSSKPEAFKLPSNSKQSRRKTIATIDYAELDSESEVSSWEPPLKTKSVMKKKSQLSKHHLQHNAGSDAKQDHFNLDLRLESSSTPRPLVSLKHERDKAIYNLHTDIDSEVECLSSLKPTATLIDKKSFGNLDSESDTSSFDLKLNSKSANQTGHQKTGIDLKISTFKPETQSENSSLQSLPTKCSIKCPGHDQRIASNENDNRDDMKPSKNDAMYLHQNQILRKATAASTKSTSKGNKIGSSTDSDNSLIMLDSTTDEEMELSSKHQYSKPSSKTNSYASPQSSNPGTKKRPRKSNSSKDSMDAFSSSDSSDDSLFQYRPFSRLKSCGTVTLQTNCAAVPNAKTTQVTVELASSQDTVNNSKVGLSKAVKSAVNLKMTDLYDSDSIFTQDPSSDKSKGLELRHNPYKKMDLSTSTTTNSPANLLQQAKSAKDDVPTPALPSVKEIGGRLYPDLRHQCIKALISHAKLLRRAIHQRGALDASIRAILVFSFHPYPIRSPEAAANLKGIGSELLEVFKNMLKSCSKEKSKPYYPPRGKFSSVAAASLVVLDDYEREGKGNTLCSMEELITRVNVICHNPTAATHILDRDVEYYLNKENIDPGWLQIRKLGSGNEPFIKERRKKASCPSGIRFELTEQGRAQAQRLRQIASHEPVQPGPLRQLASFFVDKAYGSVTMSMDFREGGGNTKSLHKLCDLLDEYRVPYVVRSLKISDYVYFVGNKMAPILIERKSIDDLAGSLVDGRWENQQRNMRKAQFVLGKGEQRRCQICYIIEGEAGKRVVHGGVVARTSWDVSLEQVENAIASLPQLGFSVMKSKSHMGTMNILSQIARDICWKYRNGSIDCLMTYEEFNREMARCPDIHGDPPTRPEHMNPIPPVVDAVTGPLQESRDAHVNHDVDPRLLMRVPSSPSSDQSFDGTVDRNKERSSELEKLSLAELRELCTERDEKVSGTKKDLIERLLQERKPEILLTRARRNQYVPRLPSSNAALLVALHLNHIPGTEGLTKERLMLLADETGVSKDPMGGKCGWYDGWSGMKEMVSGDPPLVSVVKRKYSLTTQPSGSAGIDVAKALHTLSHKKNLCRCGSFKV